MRREGSSRVAARPWLRRPILAAGAAIGLGFLLVVDLGIPWWLGRPWDGRLADGEGRVSIVIPWGWIDATPDQAGQVVTDDSGEEIEPYRLPDLAAEAYGDGEMAGPQRVDIAVLPAGSLPLGRRHAEHRAAVCADPARCVHGWRPAVPMTVDGHPATAQFVRPPATAEVVWAVTVTDGTWVVRFTGTSTDWRDDEDGGELARVLRTLRMPAS